MTKSALIVSGGLGTRLHPFTKVIPKPLMPIGSQTLLERHIENLVQHGFRKIYVAVQYFKEIFEAIVPVFCEKYNIEIEIILEEVPLGTFGSALELCRKREFEGSDLPILVLNADIVSDINYDEFYRNSIAQSRQMVVVINDYECYVPYGVVSEKLGSVLSVREKPKIQFPILSGIYLIAPSISKFVNIEKGSQIGVDIVIDALLKREIPIGIYRHAGHWVDTGTLDDLLRANDLFNLKAIT